MTLKQIVEGTDTWAGRAFDLFIQGLIVVSLVDFSLDTLPNLSLEARFWLIVLELVTVGLFTIEYGLRILVADDPVKFVCSVYGLIDLAAILPFYLAVGVDLRGVRVLRLFRVFRVFKLLRYSKALRRFKRAVREVKEELILYFIAAAMMMFLASVGIYYFESEAQPDHFGSIFHCLWWAIVTLTTVGYGDAYPITVGGRIFTSVVLLVGLGIVAVPTGLLASALTQTREEERASATATQCRQRRAE